MPVFCLVVLRVGVGPAPKRGSDQGAGGADDRSANNSAYGEACESGFIALERVRSGVTANIAFSFGDFSQLVARNRSAATCAF